MRLCVYKPVCCMRRPFEIESHVCIKYAKYSTTAMQLLAAKVHWLTSLVAQSWSPESGEYPLSPPHRSNTVALRAKQCLKQSDILLSQSTLDHLILNAAIPLPTYDLPYDQRILFGGG